MTNARTDSKAEFAPLTARYWVPVRLSRVLVGIKDGTHGTFERVDSDGCPLLSAKNVQDGYLRVGDAESLITERDHRAIVANGYPRAGDLLLTIVGTIGRAAVYDRSRSIAFQRSVCFLRFSAKQSPVFMSYMARSKYFQDQLIDRSKSAAQAGVYMGDVAACLVYSPPLEVQNQIADYLDLQTAKIDVLIDKQEQLIEALAERRQAVINQAVTKGLDPSVPMKRSGQAGLGDVPSEWNVQRVSRTLVALRDGTHGTFARVSGSGKQLLSAKNVREGRLVIGGEESEISQSDHDEIVANGFPRCGDVLLTIVGTIGRVAVFQESALIAFQRSVAFLRFSRDHIPHFMAYQIQSNYFQDQLLGRSKSSAQAGVYLGDVAACIVIVPPTEAQRDIVRYLDAETSKMDALSVKAREMIDVLKERRQALISAAVTGKIDVRGLS